MNSGVFVSGTDTGIGKTHVSCALVGCLRAHGIAALGMKPVASGSRQTAAGLRNEDAEALIAAAGFSGDYGDINPHAFADAIAPHLAARDNATSISIERIRAAYLRLAVGNRFVVVEGVGGWLVPLGDQLMQADIVHALQLPVLLVVGLRLGCINHALLSARAIEADGCRLVGWIGNRIDPAMQRVGDNIETLKARIQAPLLAIVEHAGQPDSANDNDPLDSAVRALLADASA